MTHKTNIIQVNGKHYDAKTGHVLGAPVRVLSPRAPKSIDGFSRRTPDTILSQPLPPVTAVASTKKKVMDISRGSSEPVKAHKPQSAQTLMRHAVKRPARGLKRTVKSHTRTDVLTKVPKLTIIPKHSYYNISDIRLARAKRVAKSQLIRRFADITVAPAVTQATSVATIQPTLSADIRPVYAAHSAPKASTSDIFEHALARATSHEQHTLKKAKHHKHPTKRTLTMASLSLAVVGLTALAAHFNSANITMRFASAKAGFSASMPAYHPAGYSSTDFTYKAGVVAIGYHNAGSGQYTVIQKPSSWNSQELLSNYVMPQNATYRTVVAAGRTLYIYGNNEASWIDGHVWYRVVSDGQLNQNQLVNLATSL